MLQVIKRKVIYLNRGEDTISRRSISAKRVYKTFNALLTLKLKRFAKRERHTKVFVYILISFVLEIFLSPCT